MDTGSKYMARARARANIALALAVTPVTVVDSKGPGCYFCLAVSSTARLQQDPVKCLDTWFVTNIKCPLIT